MPNISGACFDSSRVYFAREHVPLVCRPVDNNDRSLFCSAFACGDDEQLVIGLSKRAGETESKE